MRKECNHDQIIQISAIERKVHQVYTINADNDHSSGSCAGYEHEYLLSGIWVKESDIKKECLARTQGGYKNNLLSDISTEELQKIVARIEDRETFAIQNR